MHKRLFVFRLSIIILTSFFYCAFINFQNVFAQCSGVNPDLATHVAEQIDSRLNLSSPSSGLKMLNNLGWHYDGDNKPIVDAVWNQDSWIKKGVPLDFSGMIVGNDDISSIPQGNIPHGGGALITPRHFITANHYGFANGTTLFFLNLNGQYASRKLVKSFTIAGTDINIGLLDSDLDPSFTYYPIISHDTLVDLTKRIGWDPIGEKSQSAFSIPIIIFNKYREAFVRSFGYISMAKYFPPGGGSEYFVPTIYHRLYGESIRSGFSKDLISGDSGQPGFLIVNNKPILLFTNWTSSGSPELGYHISRINSAIDSMGNSGGYHVTEYVNSCFVKPKTELLPPTNFIAKTKTTCLSNATEAQVTLSWEAPPASSVTGDNYKLNSLSSDDEEPVYIPISNTSYVDSKALPGEYRYYSLETIYGSSKSAEVTAKVSVPPLCSGSSQTSTSPTPTPSSPTYYFLTVMKSGTGSGTISGGSISCGSTCKNSFVSGTSVTLTATPSLGSTFVGWSGSCSGTGSCTVALNSSKIVTATFNLQTQTPTSYSLSVSKSGTGSGTVSGGSISCGSTCSQTSNSGTSVTLTATPSLGSTFVGWSGSCSGTGSCTVVFDSSKNVNALFNIIPPTNKAPEVAVSGDQTIEWPNSSVTVMGSATDDGLPSGSQLKLKWSAVGDNSNAVSFNNPNNSQTVVSFTSPGTYSLNFSASDGSLSTSKNITVKVEKDSTPPVRSDGLPVTTLSATTQKVKLSLNTNETAKCYWSSTPNTVFDQMSGRFSVTDGTNHYTDINLSPGNLYNFYVRCRDLAQNTNSSDYPILFAVAGLPVADTVITDSAAPNISINFPLNGQILEEGEYSVRASASDNVGVVGVQFYLDEKKLNGEDVSVPWNTDKVFSPGTYRLYAIARDAAGNKTTSNTVKFIIEKRPEVVLQPVIVQPVITNTVSNSNNNEVITYNEPQVYEPQGTVSQQNFVDPVKENGVSYQEQSIEEMQGKAAEIKTNFTFFKFVLNELSNIVHTIYAGFANLI